MYICHLLIGYHMKKYFFWGCLCLGFVSCSPGEKELLEAGISKIEVEEYQEAINYLDRALAINPENIKAYNAKSFALFALKEYQGVVENNLEAIKVNSTDYKPFYNMANARLKLGQLEEAITDYTKAIGIKPNEADIYLNRGTAYYRAGAYPKAIEDFNFAEKLDKNMASIFYNRAKTYLKIDSVELSIRDFTQTINLTPDHGEAHYWLGLSKILCGNAREGCVNLKKSKALGYKNAAEVITKNCE